MKLLRLAFKEEKGSLFEYVILLSFIGVAAVLIIPHLREFLVDTYNKSVNNIEVGISGGNSSNNQGGGGGDIPLKYKFEFDGTNYIQLNDNLMYFGTDSNDFSLEGWFRLETSNTAAVFAKNGSRPQENYLLMGFWGKGYHLATSLQKKYDAPVTGKRYEKVHIAWVVKNNVLKIYENGTNVWTTNITARDPYTDEAAPTLGMETDNGLSVKSDFFVGTMDQVRLYNRALSDSEVQGNMKGSVVKTAIAAEYLFDDGSGDTIKDSSGNGNHAKIIGKQNWKKI
ncbi:LamG domain-containing protein [Bacillus toyonensis]|uniref:LamG domain-containing protein n=1 Tax=Bacillus toyonensis TaxID=155322 RepID=UPI002E1E3050|nr:LamG domain-containing protein [Bacillus toyonensis]